MLDQFLPFNKIKRSIPFNKIKRRIVYSGLHRIACSGPLEPGSHIEAVIQAERTEAVALATDLVHYSIAYSRLSQFFCQHHLCWTYSSREW